MKEGLKKHHFHERCPWTSSAVDRMLSYPNFTFCCNLPKWSLASRKLPPKLRHRKVIKISSEYNLPSTKFSQALNFSSALSVLKQLIPYASFLLQPYKQKSSKLPPKLRHRKVIKISSEYNLPSTKFSQTLNFSSALSVLKQLIPYASFLLLFQLTLRKYSCLESNKIIGIDCLV